MCPGGMIQQCKSLVALGGIAQVGLDCRPYFMARQVMQHQLGRLQKYNTNRWTQQRILQLKEGVQQPVSQDARPEPRPRSKRQWTDEDAMKMTFRTGVRVKIPTSGQLSGMGAT